MNKMTRSGILFFIILLLSFSGVFAWGINPARQRASHLTDTQFLSVTLENPQHVEGYFKVSFSGDLARYAHYSGPLIYVYPEDTEYVVPFTLKLPDELTPGTNKLSVNLEQISAGGTATVSSLIMLVADVMVDVPVEGNHVVAQLAVGRAEMDDPTPFTISIVNKGESATVVWADVSIKGPTNKELASWTTDKQVLDYQGNGKITTFWKGSKEPGLYHAEVSLHHDDKVKVLRQTFMVGSKEVVSESIGSDAFRLGGIVPLHITARNKWNEQIDDVFAEVFVLSEQGAILQSFKTASEGIGPLGRSMLTGYWDTAKLVVGSYDLNVIMHFDDGQSQQSYPVVVKMDELEVTNLATGEVTAAKSDGLSQNSLFVVLLVILVVTNVIIIVYFRRMKKR